MSFLCGISNNRDPVLMPNSFNLGVAANTTDPWRLVSATTASFVFNGSNPFSIQETLAKSSFGQYIEHPYLLINDNYTLLSLHYMYSLYTNVCSISIFLGTLVL